MALFYVHGLPVGPISIMLALIASIGGFIFGYDTGQISDILLMDDFLLRFATCSTPGDASTCVFSTVREGLIVSLLSIGTLVGALIGALVADRLGRRWAMVVECIVFAVGVIIQITSEYTWQQFAVGRLISGLGIGSLSAAVPMYQAETAPAQIRGGITATYQLFITIGILVAYSISIGTRDLSGSGSWRTVVGISLVWPTILALGILTLPESPRWLVARGRLDEARRSIARVRGISPKLVEGEGEDWILRREMDEITSNTPPASSFSWHESLQSWLACFAPAQKTLYRTILGVTLQSLQQLTGANYFFYYGATVFTSVGISDPYVVQIILGAVNVVCTFGGLYVMEKYGRRLPLIIGGIWQSAWLFVFAAAGTAKNPEGDKSIGTLMIVSACMFILGYAMTWGPCIWILTSETFPTATRAKQSALSTASNWTWNFLISFFTPFISRAIGYSYGFVFAGCNLAGAIIVYFFLYESSDLTLESVNLMYTDPQCKPWTSRNWAPPGFVSRQDLIVQARAADAGKEIEGGGGTEERLESIGTGVAPGMAQNEKRNLQGSDGSSFEGTEGMKTRNSETTDGSGTMVDGKESQMV